MPTLFERARQGDAAAAAEIDRVVRDLARRVCAFGGPGGAPDCDWEDVAQEATRRMLETGLDQYRGTGSERSYIFTVVKCTVIQIARSAARRRRREKAALADAAPESPNTGRRLDVRKILDRLDGDCSALIERVVLRDEPYARVAGDLGLAEVSVRARLSRCLKKARAIASRGGRP